MKSFSFWAAILCCMALSVPSFAQKNKFKLADVSAADFEPKFYSLDSSAQGIVLADIGSSDYEVDNTGGFNIILKKHIRTRLLNRNAFDEATMTIPLYSNSQFKERILKMEAKTYHLEGGKVVETKLEKSAIFEEKLSNSVLLTKFTMPNLQEGCIIDISYVLSSPFERNLRDWYFQKSIPVLHSEYSVSVPAIYDFVIVRQGFNTALPVDRKIVPTKYTLRSSNGASRAEYFDLSTDLVTTKWTMENIAKTSSEPFNTSLRNRIDKVEFQLSAIRYPNQPVRFVMNGWQKASEQLMERDDFGKDLTTTQPWYKDELQKIAGSNDVSLEVAKKIFYAIRDNFTCKNHDGLYTNNSLKKVYQAKAGNVAEINLLLVAMLRNQGFFASPVILSTREHGKANEVYPVMEKFNYVIAGLTLDGKQYLLDASYNKMAFGKLPKNAWNGFGRMIDANPVEVQMAADSVTEQKITSVLLLHNEKDELEGEVAVYYGDQESYDVRETLAKKPMEEFVKSTIGRLPAEYHATAVKVDSVALYEAPVKLRCDIKLDKSDEDIIYFNPIFYEGMRENPFKAGERKYPIEMESAMKEVYSLVMEVPKGYKVDELPKSVRVFFNENEGMFEYIINNSNGMIQLKCTLQLNKANFAPEDYQNLRDFFAFVVNKENEQIVFKKL